MEAICYSLLFADKVFTEDNGKKGIIGVFGAFNFPKFPAITPPWFIYAGLANISGKHEFSINLVRDEAQQVVLPISGEIEIPENSKEVEIVIPISNLTFQKAGIHILTLNIDGVQLMSRILRVSQLEASGGIQ